MDELSYPRPSILSVVSNRISTCEWNENGVISMANENEYSENRCPSRDRLILKEHQVITSEFVRFFAGLNTNMIVLDAVCGDGFFLEILRNLGFESIYGLDTVVPDLEIARSKGLRVLEGGIYDLDLRDKLDVVLLCNNLEYMENPGLAIARVCDGLKEGGILYLITTAYDSDDGKSRRWFRRKVKENVDTNQRVFSMNSLFWLLESHQFKIENTFKQPSSSLTPQKRYFKEKQNVLVSIAARKKKLSKSANITSKSTLSEEKLEQEKTDAPFFQTEDEELIEKTVPASENDNKHGDDSV